MNTEAVPVTPVERKRRARNLLLDARYQLTFALPLVLVVAVLFAVLGRAATTRARAATQVGLQQLELLGVSEDDAAAETLAATLHRREQNIERALWVSGIAACVALLLFGVALTHRVAGPLYRVRRVLEGLRDGRYEEVGTARRGDLLTSLLATLSATSASLRAREERDRELARTALSAIATAPGLDGSDFDALRELAAKKAGPNG